MKANILLKNILAELSAKRVKLAQATLDNGTVLEAEAFEAGNEVFIVTEEERIPLPVGEYTMEDGSILYVAEEGVISEVKSAGAEAEEEVAEVAIEAEEEIAVEVPEEVAAPMEEVVAAVVEAVAPVIEEIQAQVEEMKKEMGIYKEKMSKQAAAKPIKHNPAKKEEKASVSLAANRASRTIDRVMAKMNNFK